jgi:hypothetical protein
MRKWIFGAVLAVVASAGLYMTFASSIAAAWDARPATFAQRFAPVLKSG